mmetsp:Transcript_11764/g.21431  ORF Transcript_11764/g.21431 Transcript_11764/m.21431 type:complete len:287 (+) Transcript_11764:958-1818(+)
MTSSAVLISSHSFSSKASVPNHVSPVATLSISRMGRFSLTKVLKSFRISSISSFDFLISSGITFLVGVIVLLYLPAVIVWNSIPSFLSLWYTFGTSLITPIEPRTANGDAIILSATHVIMYPPLAATCSTQIVSFIPFSLNRFSCAAAKPYPVTVPPPVCNTTNASSPGLALRTIAVTSSRRLATCDAVASPGNSVTKMFFRRFSPPSISLMRDVNGRSCNCDKSPPAPRAETSPRRAALTPLARSGPKTLTTFCTNSNSTRMRFSCSTVTSLKSFESFVGMTGGS